MSNEKLISIQEKIHAERLKIQEKLQKNVEIPQKIEEKLQKTEEFSKIKYSDIADEYKFAPKNVEETKRLIEESIIDRDFDNRAFDRHETDYSTPLPSLMTGIMILVIGFTLLTMGNFISSSISQAITFAEPETSVGTTTTVSDVLKYVDTTIPLFGVALLVLGFATILIIIRPVMNDNY